MKKNHSNHSMCINTNGTVVVLETAMAIRPAPNVGDCNPDGSGFETLVGQNGEANGRATVPNAGNGIPDSPGWE